MIRIRDLSLRPEEGEGALKQRAAKVLGIDAEQIRSLQICKKSIDARRKPDVRLIYTVDVAVSGDERRLLSRAGGKAAPVGERGTYTLPVPPHTPEQRPVVVGFGPAGLFAALILARAGLRPLVLERGLDVARRAALVEQFWRSGVLDPACNVQFGEGGAGAFSDGKLNTGIRNERIAFVLDTLHRAGAPEEILYDARPHVGTDVLRDVVRRLREEILSLGGEVRFGERLDGLCLTGGALTGLVTGRGEQIPCTRLILAVGHSARDTFIMLHAAGVPMEPKAFSMGVRIEHRQADVDFAQYGAAAETGWLPPADYHLSCHFPEGDSAYTFCMCPGGYVVAAASEESGVVTNGMSFSARDGENANSALLVTLHPEMFPDKSVLGGMYWQRELEQRAFQAGGGGYRAPAQRSGDFLAGRSSTGPGRVVPSYRPGVTWCDLHDVLPKMLTDTLEKAIPRLGRQLRGFDDPDAVLTAPETRSSSPVRILRDKNTLQSHISGLYPCGEGAGYAGGIVSAAVDGMRCAEALIQSL